MVVAFSERRAARAVRWEMDLSGGVCRVPLRVRAGSMRVLSAMASEDFDLLFGQFSDVTLGQVAQDDGAYADPPQREQVQSDCPTRPAYYAVTSFVYGEVEGGFVGGAGTDVRERWGEHHAVLEGGTGAEGGEGFLGGRVCHGHFVF